MGDSRYEGMKVWPTQTPGDQKQFHLCAPGGLQAIQDGILAIVLQGETTTGRMQLKATTRGSAKDHRPGGECCSFLNPINISRISKPLTYTLFSLQKGHFKMELKTVC